ncbi:RNA transcription, translation and transport factor protein [Centruroides vittatus]|uniref:RNA transcription, translation and transport factor protein n=1 Tax=Centruroides vittatus TaxID=120091 RepID=UPI0035100B8D
MFKRKLSALGFHKTDDFDVNSCTDLQSLVVWLEDQKIRHYKIEERECLRNIGNTNWKENFSKYLNDLGCPFNHDDKAAVIDWLLGLAVRLDYGDNREKYKDATSENIKNKINAPVVVQKNPLDNLDFDSPEFKAGVASLASLLNITQHPNHLITLKAICTFVKDRLSDKAIAAAKDKKFEGKPFPLQESDLGFDTGDYVLNHAAKILRLLYINDLRDLQTRINEALVAVQTVTANPKTDTRLGKVGR